MSHAVFSKLPTVGNCSGVHCAVITKLGEQHVCTRVHTDNAGVRSVLHAVCTVRQCMQVLGGVLKTWYGGVSWPSVLRQPGLFDSRPLGLPQVVHEWYYAYAQAVASLSMLCVRILQLRQQQCMDVQVMNR